MARNMLMGVCEQEGHPPSHNECLANGCTSIVTGCASKICAPPATNRKSANGRGGVGTRVHTYYLTQCAIVSIGV
jgi:hypothetical protein